MRRRIRAATFAVSAAVGSALVAVVTAPPAAAHEEVKLGTVSFEIGFLNEPAYAGSQNGVFLLVQRGGSPVEGADRTLKVEVRFGELSMAVPLQPNFDPDAGGAPGQYVAAFIPTRPGEYTFHLSGTIAGQKIDRSFTSGPRTFDEVQDPTSVEFPVKDPTLGQVAERLDREFPRIGNQLAATRRAASDKADSAKTLAYAGLGVGALGLIVAIVALILTRRRVARAV